jgi:endoglucanase
MAAGSRALVSELLSAGSLPPDWVRLTAGAPLVASPSPTQSDPYGFDAVRLPIRWAASCDISDRRAVAGLWRRLGPAARRGRPTVDLAVHDGSGPQRRGVASPVGSVAAAAAGWAAGAHADALSLLARAETQNRAHPTYYSSAWVALGRVFLQTRRLGTCGA